MRRRSVELVAIGYEAGRVLLLVISRGDRWLADKNGRLELLIDGSPAAFVDDEVRHRVTDGQLPYHESCGVFLNAETAAWIAKAKVVEARYEGTVEFEISHDWRAALGMLSARSDLPEKPPAWLGVTSP